MYRLGLPATIFLATECALWLLSRDGGSNSFCDILLFDIVLRIGCVLAVEESFFEISFFLDTTRDGRIFCFPNIVSKLFSNRNFQTFVHKVLFHEWCHLLAAALLTRCTVMLQKKIHTEIFDKIQNHVSSELNKFKN